MDKGQVAYEFMIIFFVLSLGFTIWISFSYSVQDNFQKDKDIRNLDDFSLSIKHDLFVIAQMDVGFSRVLELPPNVMGRDYVIGNENRNDLGFSTVYINSSDIGFYGYFDVPLLSGTLKKGENELIKEDEYIVIK